MENYYFNPTVAQIIPLQTLFKMLLGLVEVQRKATLYRTNVRTDLSQFGVCTNLQCVVKGGTSDWLQRLFFKGNAYPITPYWTDSFCEAEKRKARWGHNKVGNQRVAMLNRMIKDLTHYLTHKA